MYVIAQPQGHKRPLLLKVSKSSGGRSIGIVPDSAKWSDPTTCEFTGRDVIVHLGDNPPYGTAYGVLVEPVENRKIIKGWGEIYWFVKADDSVVERVHKAFRIMLARMKQRGMDTWHPVVTEVRNVRGHVAATYHYNPKAIDKIVFRPQQGQGVREMLKVLSHEAAHGVWFRQMTAEDRSEWIELYEQYISVNTVTPSDVKSMVRSMRQIDGVRPFMKNAEPEDQAAANIYLGWLRSVHGISIREVSDLISAGRKLPIPDTHLHRSNVNTPITLYSKSSPAELFAEALSSDVVGDLQDAHIRKMLKGK